MIIDIRQVCKNCVDYNPEKEECTVRYTTIRTDTKQPMKRKPNQGGCVVFMSNSIYSTKPA